MPRNKPDTQPVPEELSDTEVENVIGGGQTLSLGGKPTVGFQEPLVGFQEPLVGKVKKLTDEQDYPIEHGI